MEEISNLCATSDYYDNIIRNNYGSIISVVNNDRYILVREQRKRNKSNYVLSTISLKSVDFAHSIIDHSDWVYLWSKKIDNIEYQLCHVIDKYPILRKSVNYYIGMTENAIEYIKNSFAYGAYNDKVISHIRISEGMYNPQNLIIDYDSRDVAEYLKYIFINNTYKSINLEKILFKNKMNDMYLRLVYGRMFFPSFYFDTYYSLINKVKILFLIY